MSPEVALLHETWDAIKTYIPAKERMDVALNLVELFDDHVDIEDIDLYKNEFDTAIKAAILSHYGEDDHDDVDEW